MGISNGFLPLILLRSLSLQQSSTTIDHTQPLVNARGALATAREATRENGEERGPRRAEDGRISGVPLARQRRGTAPILAFRARKNPNRERLGLGCWWWGGDPRQTSLYQRVRGGAEGCGQLCNPSWSELTSRSGAGRSLGPVRIRLQCLTIARSSSTHTSPGGTDPKAVSAAGRRAPPNGSHPRSSPDGRWPTHLTGYRRPGCRSRPRP